MATTQQVRFKGDPVEISPGFPDVGQQAADFTLTGQDLGEQSLADYGGQRKILSIVASIDTGGGATSARRFNQRGGQVEDTAVLILSGGLPFAAARFKGAEELDQIQLLSTFRPPEFARNYGVSILSGPMAGLCARAVLVLDEDNQVLYTQLVDEITHEPDYEAAINALE